MKKEDFENLKQQLENLELEVERLKRENPDDDYQELDESIEKFRQMISEPGQVKIKRMILRKRIISTILGYVFHVIITFCVLGFFTKFLDDKIKNYILPTVLGLSFVVFSYRRLSKILIFKGPLKNHKILYTTLLYFLFSLCLGLIDYSFINIWTGIWECVISIIVLGLVLDIGEFIYYRKLFAKYKR